MNIPRRVSRSLFASAAVVAVVLAAAPLAAGATYPAPTPSPVDAKAYLVNPSPALSDAATAPPNQDLWTKTVDAPLGKLTNSFPDIVGQGSWDEKTGVATYNYYTGADLAQEAAFLTAARQVDALVPSPLKLVWRPVNWNNKERSSLVQEITANPEIWTSYFGSAPQSGLVDINGNIHVSLADKSKISSAPGKTGVLPDGTPFIAEPPSTVDWQLGRTNDTSSWTGGDKIMAGQ